MYRLIIADDETIIRENILKTVDFKSYGFEVTACCENGLEVLEKAEQQCPDLVITDIQMPFMDGVAMAKELKVRYPAVQIVFLTGYDEFEYAQQAVAMQAFDYLLKPISAQTLGDALAKIKLRLDEELQLRQDITTLKKHYETSLPILCSSFLNDLLTFSMSRERIDERAASLGIDFLGNDMFCVSVISIDPDYLTKLHSQRDFEVFCFAVYNIAAEVLQNGPIIPVFRGDETALITAAKRDEWVCTIRELEAALEHIYALIRRFMPFTVSTGVSEACESPAQLSKCYHGAVSALDYRIVLGGNRTLFIRDLEPEQNQFPIFDHDMENKLHFAIKIGTDDDLQKAVDTIVDHAAVRRYPPLAISGYFVSVFLSLTREAASGGIDNNQDTVLWRISKLSELSGLEEIRKYLYASCVELRRDIFQKRRDTCAVLALQAVEYMKGHYRDSKMSTNTVCQHLAISGSYLSSIFKKEMGKSIGSYILQLRMEKARELICTQDVKNYEAAEAVGYKDPHYFSYTFKKYFGISPNEMRKNPSAIICERTDTVEC